MIALPQGKIGRDKINKLILSAQEINDSMFSLVYDDRLFIGDYCGCIQDKMERTGIYYDSQDSMLKVIMATNDPLSMIINNVAPDKIGKTLVPWTKAIRSFKTKDISFDDLAKKYKEEDNVLTYIVKWLMNAADQNEEFWRVYFSNSLDFNNEKRILDEGGNISLDKFNAWMDMFGLKFDLHIVRDYFDDTSDDDGPIESTDFEVKVDDTLNIFATRVVTYIHKLGYTSKYVKDKFSHIPNKRSNYITSLKGGKTRFDSFLKWKNILEFDYIVPIILNDVVLCYYSSRCDTMLLPIRC